MRKPKHKWRPILDSDPEAPRVGTTAKSRAEVAALKARRKFLMENLGRVKARRISPERVEMRKRLDETLLAFRVARRSVAEAGVEQGAGSGSWLRMVRQATGVPVDVLAGRLGVCKYEIFRLEKAERESRIVLATLRKTAEALGCELVYALAPRSGSLEDLADAERRERERARAEAKRLQEEKVKAIEKSIGWRETMRRVIRCELRNNGIRVR